MSTTGPLTKSRDPLTERLDRWSQTVAPELHTRSAALVFALTLSACAEPQSETPKTQPRTLVDHRQWTAITDLDDPLADHQPATIECGVAGWYVEYDALEVDTGRCNYPRIEHPALLDVPAGSEITTQLRYYDLVAPEPAEAHVAILIGAQVQWETTVAIPQAANVLELTWRTPSAITAGDPVRFHLHNHGQNHWGLDAIMATVPIDP